MHWHKLPMKMMESPSLEVFKRHLDLCGVIWFSGLRVTVVLLVGCLDLVMLKVSSNFDDCMISGC